MESEAVLIPLTTYEKHFIPLEFYNERQQRFDMIHIDARPIGVIGALVLFKDYHEDQLWLPFCAFVLAHAPPSKEERRRKASELAQIAERVENARRWRAMHRDDDGDDDWSYRSDYERDRAREEIERKLKAPMYVRDDEFYKLTERVEQAFLPFVEIQQCEEREFHYVKHTWDKNGKPPPQLPVGYNYDRMTSRQIKRYEDDRPLLELPIPLPRQERGQWLKENITGRFYLTDKADQTVMFERYPDWLFARLRFAGAGKTTK